MKQSEAIKMQRLFNVYLDLSYSVEDYDYRISDMQTELKQMKKDRNKAKRLLAKVTEQYEKVHGRKPPRHKK